MWCNDLESNAAEPREISCHVSPGGGGGEYQFRCANIRTVMIDVVETDRGRLFRGALSLYPACIYSNIKIRVQRPPVRGWYGSMRLSNGRDPPSSEDGVRPEDGQILLFPIQQIFRPPDVMQPSSSSRPRDFPSRENHFGPSWWVVLLAPGRGFRKDAQIRFQRVKFTRVFFFSTWKAIPTGKVWTDVVRRVFYLSANFPYGRFRLPVN